MIVVAQRRDGSYNRRNQTCSDPKPNMFGPKTKYVQVQSQTRSELELNMVRTETKHGQNRNQSCSEPKPNLFGTKTKLVRKF